MKIPFEAALSGLAVLLITGTAMVSLLVVPPSQTNGATDRAALAIPVLA